MENILVIDRGSFYIKLSIFKVTGKRKAKVENPNFLDNCMFALERTKIIKNDNYSINSLSIVIKEFINSQPLKISKAIFVYPKDMELSRSIENVENFIDKNQLIRHIKHRTIEKKVNSDLIADWQILNYSEYDKHINFYNTIVGADSVMDLLNMFKKLGIRDAYIVDNAIAMTTLAPKLGNYLLVDIGYSSTDLILIRDGIITSVLEVKVTSKQIDEAIKNNAQIITEDLLNYKHRLIIGDFDVLGINQFFSNLKISINDFLLKNLPNSKNILKGIIFTGGTAEQKIETYLPDLRRHYIDEFEGLMNIEKIPTRYRNYLFSSIAAVKYLHTSDSIIDLASSKEGGLNLFLRNIMRYEKPISKGLTAAILAMVAYNVFTFSFDRSVTQAETQMLQQFSTVNPATVSTVQNEIASSRAQLEDIINQLHENESSILKISKITERVTQFKPSTLYIEEMELRNGQVRTDILALDVEDVRNFKKVYDNYLFDNTSIYGTGIINDSKADVFRFSTMSKGFKGE